jgi:hypothetical protein
MALLLLPLDVLLLVLLWHSLPWIAVAAMVLIGLWALSVIVRAAVRIGIQGT